MKPDELIMVLRQTKEENERTIERLNALLTKATDHGREVEAKYRDLQKQAKQINLSYEEIQKYAKLCRKMVENADKVVADAVEAEDEHQACSARLAQAEKELKEAKEWEKEFSQRYKELESGYDMYASSSQRHFKRVLKVESERRHWRRAFWGAFASWAVTTFLFFLI